MKGVNARHVVPDTKLELMSEMSDVQTHGGDIRGEKMEMLGTSKLDVYISLLGMFSTGAWVVNMVGQVLGSPFQFMQRELKTWKDD